MQIANLIGSLSGKITVYTKETEDLEITAGNNRMDINTTNKEFIKEILASLRQSHHEGPVETLKKDFKQLSNFRHMFDRMKDTADEFCDAGITITVSYQGDKMVTIGKDANPKISQIITGKSIEVNNLSKLISLAT